MRQRVMFLLGAIALFATGSALAQTTGGTWQELGPRPQTAGNVTRSGRINSIAIDFADDPTGNTVYVGSSYGGVWKTMNVLSSASNYVPLMDSQPNLAVGSIALDSSTHPATVYVATGATDHNSDALLHGNGIYKSSDGGQTWTLVGSADNGTHPFQQVGFSKILVDPSNPSIILAGATQQFLSQADTPQAFPGIYRSTDAGATWSRVSGTGSCADMVYDSAHGAYYAAINAQGIFKSTDQGATWVAAGSPFAATSPNAGNFLDAVLATRSGVVWTFIVDSSGQPSTPTPCTGGATRCDTGLAQSNDGGASWTPVSAPPVCVGAAGPSCFLAFEAPKIMGAPPNSTDLIFGNILLWVSPAPNGLATSWTSLPFSFTNQGDYHSMAFLDSQRWLLGSDLGFSFAANAVTTSFADINGNLGSTLSRSASQMGNGAYLTSSQDNAVAELVTGTTWTSFSGGDEGYSEAGISQPNQYFATTFAPLLHRSDDNGRTLVTVVDATVDSVEFPPFQQLPGDPTQVIIGTCRIWKGPAIPTSPGMGWAPISSDLTSNGSGTGPCKPGVGAVSAVAGAPSSADVIYAVTFDGHIQRTTNGTSANPNWSDVTHPPLANSSRFPFHAVAVTPADSNTAYVGVGGTGSGHVFVTRDGGSSWTNITGNLPDLSVHAIVIDPLAPQDVYLGTAAGVFVMTDGGSGGTNESWQQYGTRLPNAEVFSLEFSKVGVRQIIAATYGRGVWATAPIVVPNPVVTLSNTSLSFGNQQVATTSATQTVILTNSGAATLSIGSIAVTGNYAQTNTCGASVASGNNCSVSLTFTPTAAGTRSGTLTITDNVASSPQTVNLSGNGVDFAVSASASNATVKAGQSATYTITVSPQGGAFDNAISLTCSGLPTLASCSFSPTSVTPGANPATSTLTISTTASSALLRSPYDEYHPMLPYAVCCFSLLGLYLIVVRMAEGKTCKRRLAFAFMVVCVLAMLAAGCGGGGGGGGGGSNSGGGSNPSGTTPGTYTVTITGTSGSLQHSATTTLVVQ